MADDSFKDYYNLNDEETRLLSVWGKLEFERSKDILSRHLPPAPKVILDIGGAAGRYSCWLAAQGYETHLIDPVPLHVEQANQASLKQEGAPIASCRVGDARKLQFEDSFADASLMFGPLYHLTEKADRLIALKESHRVLKAGGMLFAAGISRFASSIDGLAQGFIFDPEFRKIVEQDLKNGQHRNHTDKLEYFTDAFFHEPQQLKAEVEEAGFNNAQVIPIEGFAYLLGNLSSYWQDEEKKNALLDVLRGLETSAALVGATAHLMCVATKK